MSDPVGTPAAASSTGILQAAAWLGWFVVVAAGVYFVQRDALRYLDYSAEGYRHHWNLRFWLIPHILGAGIALFAGYLQFSRRIRSRWPTFHRVLGRCYIAGSLLAAPAAFRLALGSQCELCTPPLAILSILWFGTTVMAYLAARRRAFTLHRQFMIRSFVLMNAFIVIRLSDFLPLPLAIQDEEARRSVFEWLCWVVPLLVTELYLSWIPAARRAFRKPSTSMGDPSSVHSSG